MMTEDFLSHLVKYLGNDWQFIFRGDVGFFPMMEKRHSSEMRTSSSERVKTSGKTSQTLPLTEKVACRRVEIQDEKGGGRDVGLSSNRS